MKASLGTEGLALVEVVISSAIILVAVLALLNVYDLYLKSAMANTGTIKAAYLSEEGIEAMKYLRDDSWSANVSPLTDGSSHGLVLSGGAWQLSGASDWTGAFQRTISVSQVYRDASGQIAASGTLDPHTKLITSTVSWQREGATTTKSVSAYIMDIWQN